MRIPDSILARVRGPVVAAALVGCSSPPPAAPPPAPVSAVPVARVVAPVDPVAYASADEDLRLSRIDAEAVRALGAREARIGHLADQRRRRAISQSLTTMDLQQLMSADPQDVGTIGTGRWSRGCAGCGRG